MDLEVIKTPGLGNRSYLLASDGEALVVDPPRDAWRVEAAAARHGLRIRQVVETHVHNDYLSGALELRAAHGAAIAAPARGGYAFEHRGVDDGDTVELGGIRLTALATPGHTPEHLSWLVHDLAAGAGAEPHAVLTGGSLLAGTAGRTDLLGSSLTPELTAAQHGSLQRLATLPDATALWPTHGKGSFCSVGPASGSGTSTIGSERLWNPLLQAPDAAAFQDALLGGLGAYPTYYAEMAPINRAGPAVLGGRPVLADLDPAAVADAVARGARVVDARSREAVAAGHVPGAWAIEHGDSFASYVGWLVPFGAALVLVLPDDERVAAATVDALVRIGYDHILGQLAGGMPAWAATGRPVATFTVESAADLAARRIGRVAPRLLDVRDPREWREEGHVDGAIHVPIYELPDRLDEIPRGTPILVACRSGQRAAIAAALLETTGHDVTLVTGGGIPDLAGSVAPPG